MCVCVLTHTLYAEPTKRSPASAAVCICWSHVAIYKRILLDNELRMSQVYWQVSSDDKCGKR